MGYRHKPQQIEVKFAEGHVYHGCEVVLRRLTLGEYLDITGLGDVDGLTVAHQLRGMSDKLIAWNLEDEQGNPIPATADAVIGQDFDLMSTILAAWLDALRGGVSAPLEQTSPDGEPSLEASIPMAVPSESLAS
jgi:hypothetical protein